MPVKIDAGDKKLLIWAGITVALLITAVALLSDEEAESSIPSTYSAQSAGAKAAYLLLQESGYKVERWEDAPMQLPKESEKTTLVLAYPVVMPTKEEAEAVRSFANNGGRVLIVGSRIQFFFAGKEVETEGLPSPDWKEYQPQLITRLTEGGAIKMSPGSYWKNKSTAYLTHYADKDRPIVVSYKQGKGEVIWWAAATPLTNASISVPGNLALFLGSIGDKDTHVLWDEYFHSVHHSLGEYVSDTPLMFGLLQCVLFGVALVLTYSRRNLPIHPLPQKSRLSPLEFVETLGGLYRRAKTTRAALEVPYHRFRSAATRHLGLRPDTSPEELDQALRRRLGYKDESLLELMRKIEETLTFPDPSEPRILELAQQLNVHMQKLKLVQQETIGHANRVAGVAPRKN